MVKDDKQTEYIPIREVERITGMGASWLRRALDNGEIKGFKTPSGQRRYCSIDVRRFVGEAKESIGKGQDQQRPRSNFIYARVSSKKQLPDLERQVEFLQRYVRQGKEQTNYTAIQDIGSGVNFKRKGLQVILEQCLQGTIGDITIAHRDRLSRFGFELIELIVTKAGGTITVIDDHKNKSSEQELAEDLLSIVHIYSCKQMGKRSYINRGRPAAQVQDASPQLQADTGAENNPGQEP